ncbi:Elicitin [Phytophthora megakarya]|uniref:Elicitin n=1 Tax=Phytophthora megakarya TaxID=4795 RepID=A0A225VAT7_9STRA|nr:Elicitin [Phytophthora megakarya]
MHRAIAALVTVLIVLVPSITARACTSMELTELTSVAATYSNSPDCAGSSLDRSTKTVEIICAGACMKLVRQLQPDAPDCEFQGTNLGETMSQLVAWCDSAGSSSASSGSTEAGSTSNSTADNTTDVVPVCSIEDVNLVNDINSEAAKNADCLGSAGTATTAANKDEYCAQDSCVAYLANIEGRLPNCTYGSYNIKQVVADTLAMCEDNGIVWPTTTPRVPTTTTQTPTVIPSGDSQAADTPAPNRSPTDSAASVWKSSASISGFVLMAFVWITL